MNKVLQRAMFSIPKHEHKSTGIASGLEYRTGYRVGGRVGYHGGGPLGHDHPHGGTNPLDINPRFGGDYLDLAGMATEQIYGGIPQADFGQFDIDRSQYATDYSKYEPTRLGAVGQAAGETVGKQFPVGQSQWADFISNLSRTSSEYKTKKDELALMADQDAKKIAMADDAEAQAAAIENYKHNLKLATDKGKTQGDLYTNYLKLAMDQYKIDEKTKVDILKIQSDAITGGGPGKPTEKQQLIAEIKSGNLTDADIIHRLIVWDLAEYSSYEIGENFNEGFLKKEEFKHGEDKWDVEEYGIPGPTDGKAYDAYMKEKTDAIIRAKDSAIADFKVIKHTSDSDGTIMSAEEMGRDVMAALPQNMDRTNNLGSAVNAITMYGYSPQTGDTDLGEARVLAINIIQLSEALKLDINHEDRQLPVGEGKTRPVLEEDLQAAIDELKKLEGADTPLYDALKKYLDESRDYITKKKIKRLEEQEGFAKGGRVGYANGGQVGISFEEMRTAFTPNQISDYDMKLLANDRTMLGDFASIRDYSELEDFNTKYATNIELPIG